MRPILLFQKHDILVQFRTKEQIFYFLETCQCEETQNINLTAAATAATVLYVTTEFN